MKDSNLEKEIPSSRLLILDSLNELNQILTDQNQIYMLTRGWKCCQCSETMYNEERVCTWYRCKHKRCSNCGSFSN
jgi:hypothetical protein